MRKHYWYAKVGEVIRLAEGETANAACKDAFGCYLNGAVAKDLGTRHPRYFSGKKKKELLEAKEGWVSCR